MAVLAKNQYVQSFVINNKELIRNKLNSLHCKKDNDKFLHLSRMTQDQMNRLTESVSDRDVGLFRHVPTTVQWAQKVWRVSVKTTYVG
jgi:hypothetical protein